MNYRILFLLLFAYFFASCKGSKPVAAGSPTRQQPSGREKTEVLNLFYNANKEKILGNLANAAELFSEVIRKDPDNHAAMYELANIYAEQKKFSDALFFIKSAYKLDPKNVWYALSLAEINQKNKRFADAAQVLEQLVKDYPDRADFYFEWASALILAERPADAVKAYDKLEEKIGMTKDLTIQKARLYQRMSKNDKAVNELQKYIAANPKDVQAYDALAEVYRNMGEKQKALELYNKVLEVDPNNPYVHLSLADFYRSNGEKEKSVEQLKLAFSNKELDVDTKITILASYLSLIELHPELKDQAMELCLLLLEANPDESRVHSMYGEFLITDKQMAKARDEFRQAKKLGGKEFGIVERIIDLDSRLQSWDTLILDADEALASFPDQPILYYYKGAASSEKKKYSEAIQSLNSGLKLIADNKKLEEEFYSMLGQVYNENKDFVKSDESYEKTRSLNPKNDQALNNYAYFLSVRGEKLDKAEAMSKLSLEIIPNRSTYEDTYGWIMYKQGKYPEAKTWIEKALEHEMAERGSYSAAVLEHYGDILYKTGETQKALEYWQKAKDAGEGATDQLDKKILDKKLPD